jgi:thymidylate synthase
LCGKLGIPVVASNKKSTGGWAITPRTCCALPEMKNLGEYGKLFGTPEFKVKIIDGRIAEISVLHSAPCGATWEAAKQTIGIRIEEAPVHIGLKTQFFCTADPAGWDVMHGKSPVHFSAELHNVALKKAIDRFYRSRDTMNT